MNVVVIKTTIVVIEVKKNENKIVVTETDVTT